MLFRVVLSVVNEAPSTKPAWCRLAPLSFPAEQETNCSHLSGGSVALRGHDERHPGAAEALAKRASPRNCLNDTGVPGDLWYGSLDVIDEYCLMMETDRLIDLIVINLGEDGES